MKKKAVPSTKAETPQQTVDSLNRLYKDCTSLDLILNSLSDENLKHLLGHMQTHVANRLHLVVFVGVKVDPGQLTNLEAQIESQGATKQ